MPNQQHTPGPWSVEYFGPEPTLDDPGQIFGVYADDAPFGERMPAQCYPPYGEANAHRIVVCVNAMEGIEDPVDYMRKVEELKAASDLLLDAITGTAGEPTDWPNIRGAATYVAAALNNLETNND